MKTLLLAVALILALAHSAYADSAEGRKAYYNGLGRAYRQDKVHYHSNKASRARADRINRAYYHGIGVSKGGGSRSDSINRAYYHGIGVSKGRSKHKTRKKRNW